MSIRDMRGPEYLLLTFENPFMALNVSDISPCMVLNWTLSGMYSLTGHAQPCARPYWFYSQQDKNLLHLATDWDLMTWNFPFFFFFLKKENEWQLCWERALLVCTGGLGSPVCLEWKKHLKGFPPKNALQTRLAILSILSLSIGAESFNSLHKEAYRPSEEPTTHEFDL